MKRIAALVLSISAACGGVNRVEVANDCQVELTSVSVQYAGGSLEWQSIRPGEMTSRSTDNPPGDRLVVSYSLGTITRSDTLEVPEGCDSSSVVSIWISGDATSVKYTN